MGAAMVLFAGCGNSGRSAIVPPASNVPNSLPHNQTFKYTGGEQTFQVPAGVNAIAVVARGAAGGAELPSGHRYGGRGGRVYAVVPVHSGEILYVFVGGSGRGIGGSGGFNGGGAGRGGELYGGYGGGGASDVREAGKALTNRILVAAGGGGQGGSYVYAIGGIGGGKIGGAGVGGFSEDYGGGGGAGGTQMQGGSGGAAGIITGFSRRHQGQPGGPGRLGHGGNGGKGGRQYLGHYGGGGGGGGGGYYGGGGGGGGAAAFASIYGGPGGGGGGGSSYVEPRASHVYMWPGWKSARGNGLVVFSWK